MPRPNKKRQAAALNLVAANAAKQEEKLERDAQEAALAGRIANIKEMPTKPTLDLKDLLSGNIGCPCFECSPNGRGGSNGLISPEMLKAKGARRGLRFPGILALQCQQRSEPQGAEGGHVLGHQRLRRTERLVPRERLAHWVHCRWRSRVEGQRRAQDHGAW